MEESLEHDAEGEVEELKASSEEEGVVYPRGAWCVDELG